MSILEIFLIGVSLSMDAFAVSICKGLCMNKIKLNRCLIVGIYFGLFQAFMPLLGYLFGSTLKYIIINVDHFIIFLSIATSIDAFAVGITFSFFEINILFSIFIIGFTTFCISFIGVLLGNKIGNKNQRKAKILGGIILIILGIKILLEHLNLLI